MKATNFKLNPIRVAVIGAALMATNGAAIAAPVTKTIDFLCPFPIIGDQLVSAQISADFPEVLELDENGEVVLPSIYVDTVNTIAEKGKLGLSLVDAEKVTGTATSINTFHTAAGDIDNTTLLTIVPTTVPTDTPGTFDVPANGNSPAQTFDTSHEGIVTLSVDDLVMDLTNYKANGQIATAPVGQFVADCALAEGADNVLVSFEVGGGTPPPPPEIPADIEVNPSSVEFGVLQLGQTVTKTVTISNVGELPLTITNISSDNSAFLVDTSCDVIEGLSTCDLTVTYIASEEGLQNGTLVIASTDEDEASVEVALSGTGELEVFPEIEVTQTALDFGEIDAGTSAAQTITINNVGGAALTISGLEVSGSEFVKTADNCSTVNAGESCSAEVTYTSTVGASTGSVEITSDDADEPSTIVTLSGTGKEEPVDPCVVNPDAEECQEPPTPGVKLNFDVNGSSYIAANHGTIPLEGVITNNFDLLAGTFTGELLLNPTQGSFEIIQGWKQYQATAQIEFEPVGQTTGTLIDGKLTAISSAYVKLPKVTKTMFGFINWKIGGGSDCRTKEPVQFTVNSLEGERFNPLVGGQVTGSYTMPALENCGLLTSILSSKMKGAGNTIELNMLPILD